MQSLKYYDYIQRLCLMDDILMAKCFAGHNECVDVLVRVILGRDDLTIESSEIQKTLKSLWRSVVLDIHATDTDKRKYNVEFQRWDKGASPERARFNASMIDVNSLKPGQDFTELPEVYVIFITEHDVLGYGLPLYQIDRVIRANNQPFADRSHIIYVNGECRDESTPLGRLVHDLFCRNAGEMYYEALAERVSYLKEQRKGVKEMSGVMEEIFAEQEKKHEAAMKKGFAERMIEGGKLALQEIAEYSGLSLSTVRRLAKKLEASQN
ncbi:MAG: PD-(D/E)XK nuclease family transposase [Synergistaceae bacterium]|nr:PD-(D/E)XK nuclease family transposase [Synergistaceae bacterium]